tara:strand:+ start:10 stop:378 length:369 start_codon:yes stop_codon:yes gene_type:complete
MSLKDKQSLYDRNQRGNLGPTVGTSIPGDGNFFTDKGLNVSPFDATPDGIGSPGGQMVDLLTKAVTSNNHPYTPHNGSLTYNPSSKDLDGAKGQAADFFDKGILSNRKGEYKNGGGPLDGRY